MSLQTLLAGLAILLTAPAQAADLTHTLGDAIHQLASQPGVPASFEPLLGRWQTQYGSRGVVPLLDLAEDTARPESERYIALMGSARLGGRNTAHRITPFLKSPSWLLRAGALRALGELGEPATGSAVLPLLQDPALAVRIEAVGAVQRLKPAGAADALVQALGSGQNYQSGRALWVPGRALAALAVLKASDSAVKLLPLLDHASDPGLQIETVATLETLTGRKLKPGTKLATRVREWKRELETQLNKHVRS